MGGALIEKVDTSWPQISRTTASVPPITLEHSYPNHMLWHNVSNPFMECSVFLLAFGIFLGETGAPASHRVAYLLCIVDPHAPSSLDKVRVYDGEQDYKLLQRSL